MLRFIRSYSMQGTSGVVIGISRTPPQVFIVAAGRLAETARTKDRINMREHCTVRHRSLKLSLSLRGTVTQTGIATRTLGMQNKMRPGYGKVFWDVTNSNADPYGVGEGGGTNVGNCSLDGRIIDHYYAKHIAYRARVSENGGSKGRCSAKGMGLG